MTTKNSIPVLLTIALSSILMGVILPGILLYFNKTFSENEIVQRLDGQTKIAYKKINEEKQELQRRRYEILEKIADTIQNLSISEINESYLALSNLKKLEGEPDKLTITPYYPKNKALLIWPLAYFGFFSIIYLSKEIMSTKISTSFYLSIFTPLYLLWRLPVWFRNSSLGNLNRSIYGVHNFDISKLGFFIQEALSLLALVVLAFILTKWLEYSDNLTKQSYTDNSTNLNALFQVTIELRKAYQHWQISSLFLAIAFAYYSYYFWAIINQTNDIRYLPQAIIIHLIWGMSWYTISLPLILANRHHTFIKDYLNNPNTNAIYTPEEAQKLAQIISIDPISSQNKLISTLLGIAAFAFPIIKSLI